jgi:hypothetical protein
MGTSYCKRNCGILIVSKAKGLCPCIKPFSEAALFPNCEEPSAFAVIFAFLKIGPIVSEKFTWGTCSELRLK